MASHKSSVKRIRQESKRKANNRYYARTTRNALKELKNETEKKAAGELLPKVTSLLDKLAKKNIIHPNKAANLKSKLARKVNSIAAK